MQTKISPAVIGVAVVVVLALCIFMYIRANSASSPQQLPPPSDTYKPGYSGSEGAAPRPRPGAGKTP